MERRENTGGLFFFLKDIYWKERKKNTFGEISERTKLKRQKQHCHIGKC